MLGYYKDPFRAIAAEQSDLMASLSNVEVRHPLDSARILEFAVACPAKLRRHRGVDRPLHREAMRGLLPPEVLGRTTKATFDRVFRRSAELLNGNPPPLNLVREWLDIRHADLVRNWPGEGRPGELSWMDWSMWSLFACSAVLKGVDNRYHTNGRA
jgi:hypothetical protein